MIRIILFDLDDTLYPRESGIMEQIRALILHYIETRLELPTDEAETLRRRYFLEYGTTMRGLLVNHQIDPDEYLHFVHDIPLHRYLHANPVLDTVLTSIPQQKVVFTNASREHARRVLDQLAIRHHFTRIVDVRDLDYRSKPQPDAYHRLCRMLDVQPEECLLVEDNARNLRPASVLGMTTVLVQDGSKDTQDGVDYAIHRVEEIGELLARINKQSAAPSQGQS